MKLPIVSTPSLPALYKHCSNVIILHIDIMEHRMNDDSAFIAAYIDHVRTQMYASIESNFVACQASRISSCGDTFIVFKSNITKKILVEFVLALFAELDIYCNQQLMMSYRYMDAMLVQENVIVKFYKTNSMGDAIKDSREFQNATVIYQHDKKPRGKQLASIDEFRSLYAHGTNSTVNHTASNLDFKQEPSSITEDSCEYHI